MKPTLPLRVWVAAGLLAITFLLVLSRVDVGSWFTRVRLAAGDDRLNLARLERSPDAAERIVAIGSSKTYYALDYDDAFAARIALEDPSKKKTFTRLVWLGPRFRDVEPALQSLQHRPPSILLVESDLLALDRDGRLPIRDNLLQITRYLRWAFLRASGRSDAPDEDLEANHGHDVFPTASECLAKTTAPAKAQYRAMAATWRLATPRKLERYLALLRPLAAAGTRIVLLDLPRAAAGRDLFPPELEQGVENSLLTIAHIEGFQRWISPVPDEQGFCDQGHLNERGRAGVSAWLAQKLANPQSRTHD